MRWRRKMSVIYPTLGKFAWYNISYFHMPLPPGYGIMTDGYTTFINASTCTVSFQPTNPPIVFDLPNPPSSWGGGARDGGRVGGPPASRMNYFCCFFVFCFSRNTSRFWRKKKITVQKNNCKKGNKKTNLTVSLHCKGFYFRGVVGLGMARRWEGLSSKLWTGGRAVVGGASSPGRSKGENRFSVVLFCFCVKKKLFFSLCANNATRF